MQTIRVRNLSNKTDFVRVPCIYLPLLNDLSTIHTVYNYYQCY